VTDETKVLVEYRMSRAEECLDEASLLIAHDHTLAFVNRLYYAIFYAVSAFLLSKGFASAKHSGVRALFHRHCVKKSLLDEESGRFYDMLFDTRQKSDYADLVRFPIEEVKPWLDQARSFVKTIKRLIM